METTKERLKNIMDALGLKPLTPASTCPGITKNAMQGLWNSDTGNVSSSILEPFCAHYRNVNCNYLLRGTGPMFIEGIENNTMTNKYYEMCKLILENKRRENDLYAKIAKMLGE